MVYVHVPFCKSFCVYCDFYSERACPTRAWADEICAEAHRRSAEIAATAAVDTLYFGGGTPSVLPSSWLGAIADACGGRSWREWTVEVNPDDITPEYASGLRALGVNRVSMGVQSLDDGMLRWMNRRHDAACARRAFDTLRRAGFDNISVDVIFGVGGMSHGMLQATLRELLSWRPEHISAYQLSVEEGSALGRLAREGRYTELPDDACASQYYLICNDLASAGYEHYEISNWALPGKRAVHNSAYWVRAPYVGLGPGAHSLLYAPNAPASQAMHATIPLHPQGMGESTPPDGYAYPLRSACGLRAAGPADYRSWNSEELSGWRASGERLTEAEIREERIMLGLRTADGISPDVISTGAKRSGEIPSLVKTPSGNLRIPEDRWFTADDIISGLI